MAARVQFRRCVSRSMNLSEFWLSEKQFERLRPLLPDKVRGVTRVDADLAKESARLQALQVKQQLGVQALSIANQAPQTITSLFR